MTADDAPGREIARAKVNLVLHVVGQRANGYHELESLVVFPALGDLLEAEPANGLSLSLDGPFAEELGAGGDNLVLQAAEALSALAPGARGAALKLTKSLPIASGIGGGSADCAAALRLLQRVWGLPDIDLGATAEALGADVPMCLAETPALVTGIGEHLAHPPPFPAFWMVLANPGAPLSTPEVFGGLERKDNPPLGKTPHKFTDLGHLVSWLTTTRNDLEDPARALRPQIGHVLSALRWDPDCLFARMSGSGATCFGIYATQAAALSAADRLRTAEPRWWVAAAPVEGWEGSGHGV